jgi:hypothetical protein
VARLAVYIAGVALGTAPALLGVIDTAAGVALWSAPATSSSLPGHRETASALARPAQADPVMHLHRVHSGAADRRLPVVRVSPVLQLQHAPCRAGAPSRMNRVFPRATARRQADATCGHDRQTSSGRRRIARRLHRGRHGSRVQRPTTGTPAPTGRPAVQVPGATRSRRR